MRGPAQEHRRRDRGGRARRHRLHGRVLVPRRAGAVAIRADVRTSLVGHAHRDRTHRRADPRAARPVVLHRAGHAHGAVPRGRGRPAAGHRTGLPPGRPLGRAPLRGPRVRRVAAVLPGAGRQLVGRPGRGGDVGQRRRPPAWLRRAVGVRRRRRPPRHRRRGAGRRGQRVGRRRAARDGATLVGRTGRRAGGLRGLRRRGAASAPATSSTTSARSTTSPRCRRPSAATCGGWCPWTASA